MRYIFSFFNIFINAKKKKSQYIFERTLEFVKTNKNDKNTYVYLYKTRAT